MDQAKILLCEQETDMYDIGRIVPNLKKMGKAHFTLAIVEHRILRVKELWSTVKKRHSILTLSITAEARKDCSYFANAQLETCMDVVDETLDYLCNLRVSLTPITGTDQQSEKPASRKPVVPLPTIDLPKFDGSARQWEPFRNRFPSLIISETRLTNYERMHYLISSVTGEALDAISHLPISDANFVTALELLKTQFEHERDLITGHLRTVFAISKLKPKSAPCIRKIRATVNSVLHALRLLKRPVDQWDDLLVYLIVTKLDDASLSDWEYMLRPNKQFPTYAELDKFLDDRARMLAALSPNQDPREAESPSVNCKQAKPTKWSSLAITTVKSCVVCKKDHPLYRCAMFLSFDVPRRRQLLVEHKRCFNCFGSGHSPSNCSNKHRCRECNAKHHTLIHRNVDSSIATDPSATSSQPAVSTATAVPASLFAMSDVMNGSSMLATARVRVHSQHARSACCRAVLDQGSQVTLISENLAQLLRLPRIKINVDLGGIGACRESARHAVVVQIGSVSGDAITPSTVAIILPTLTTYSTRALKINPDWPQLKGLKLADENLSSTDPIDLLIGVQLYSALMRNGLRVGRPDEPIAQNTILGWIVSGALPSTTSTPSAVHVHHSAPLDQITFDLQRFWEIETLISKIPLSPAEQLCEDHFASTHSRRSDGRYVVRLPFSSESPVDIGESRSATVSSLFRLEKRLQRDASKAKAYGDFLVEYEKLGHMAEVSADAPTSARSVHYIPHHAVFRESSSTTRLRVVFNASNKTSNRRSLNDFLLPGPKLQTDLSAIIMRWRRHQHVLIADIAKMYRQILIDERDVDYQRILWRTAPSLPVKEYRLLTVTYGTASAPFLALRTIRQLVSDEGSQFPLALPIVNEQMYVDDCIFGADTLDIALQMCDQLIALFNRGGFHLHKWASNTPSLLSDINDSDSGLAQSRELGSNESLKVLGIVWHPRQDAFRYKVNTTSPSRVTKRTVLSTIATLFDPLGWITPVIVMAKIMLQRLWLLSCGWDDDLPSEIHANWESFYQQLSRLESLTIPRWTGQCVDSQLELHGFADASSKAYAAVVYLRVRNPSGRVTTVLVLGKSRVAPLKTISIPRLELCAALLLAQTIAHVRISLHLGSAPCFCWSDSSVTLHWLRQSPSKWQTFIANRVAKIQELTTEAVWKHVPTADNPADCASRGLHPNDLAVHALWWSGPSWLVKSSDQWPRSEPSDLPTVNLEERTSAVSCVANLPDRWELQARYSSWSKLLRVTAMVFRVLPYLRHRLLLRRLNEYVHAGDFAINLRTSEISRTRTHWLRQIQAEVFATELASLRTSNYVAKSSTLAPLSPYIDTDGLIRVQGRLRNAPWSEAAKHPIILASHPLVIILISSIHLELLHAGPQLTLTHLRRYYWLLRARPLVRSVLHKCVSCTRERAQVPEAFMGDLPACRVTAAARAFLHTGVDYAGPIVVRDTVGRGHKSHKAYIALFVCMTTKALHLELVSDYSTSAFLASFQCFVARRGFPSNMYSDNGTTFKGAARELATAYRTAIRDPDFANHLIVKGVSWAFIPPGAPHFGGLWEASVRSVKGHLVRCIGSHTLSHEKMATLLCRIESCLNSRPIAACSDNLDDYQALTPGHFLIHTAPTSPPEPSVLELKETRLSRWQVVQRLHEQFWAAWNNDYLHTLQQRIKWRKQHRMATVGQLVLLREPRLPPSSWVLGRIIACHPGDDGIVRVVTVRTSCTEYKRPITKICFLPVHINQETQNDSVKAGGVAADTSTSRSDCAPI